MSDGLGVKEMKLLGGAGALFTSGRRRFAYGWAPIAVWDVGHGKRPWRTGTQGYDEPFRSPRCWQTSRGASEKLGQLRQPETCAVCILLAKVLTHKAYSWNLPPIASTDSIFKFSLSFSERQVLSSWRRVSAALPLRDVLGLGASVLLGNLFEPKDPRLLATTSRALGDEPCGCQYGTGPVAQLVEMPRPAHPS